MVLDDSSVTRGSLLARAKQRDSQAWSDLVDLYTPLVQSWCQRCGISIHQADDCAQDVFASVAKSLDRFQPTGNSGAFRGWLWTITINKIRDAARRESRHLPPSGGSSALRQIQEVPDPLETDPASFDRDPTDPLDLSHLAARGLQQIRDEFAQRTWRIFDRTVIDGVPTSQVAEEFQVTAATVRQVRSRILRRLRQQLGDVG